MSVLSLQCLFVTSAISALAACGPPERKIVPLVDYHVHILGPYALPLADQTKSTEQDTPHPFKDPITADRLIADLDKAGIRGALVLSEAFWVGGAGSGKTRRLIPAKDRATAARLENDWTQQQVLLHPGRLLMACGVNPMEDHAIAEVRRCANIPQAVAMKMKLGEGGDVFDFAKPADVAKLREFFEAANQSRMPIVIHLGSNGAYTAREARQFLKEIVSAAPDIPIQIAHMSSGFQHPDVLIAFANAKAAGDPLARNLYFDLSVGSFKDVPPEKAQLIADSIRKIGLENVLYASDEQPGDHHAPTGQHWQELRSALPLSEDELSAIADNIAPYMRKLFPG